MTELKEVNICLSLITFIFGIVAFCKSNDNNLILRMVVSQISESLVLGR